MSEQEKIIKIISDLRRELHSKNNLSAKEKQDKLRELEDYETVLDEINKENKITLNKKQDIDNVRKNLYSLPLNVNGKTINISGIYSLIQNTSGKFEDSIVFYKGFSNEYKTPFLVYLEINSRDVIAAPFVNVHNHLIINPIKNLDMTYALKKQCLDNPTLSDDIKTVPSIMGCLDMHKAKDFSSNRTKDLSSSINNDLLQEQVNYSKPKVSYYKSKLPWSHLKDLFKYIKENNSLDIFIQYMDSSSPEIVLGFTNPIEKVEYDEKYWDKGSDEWHDFLSKCIEKPVEEDYLDKKFNPSFDIKNIEKREMLMFITDLSLSNNKANIKGTESNGTYQICSQIPFSELKTEYVWPFFIDKSGYIVKTSQKISTYSFDFLTKSRHSITDANWEKNIDANPFFIVQNIPNYIDKNVILKNEKNENNSNTSFKDIDTLIKENSELLRQNTMLTKEVNELRDIVQGQGIAKK